MTFVDAEARDRIARDLDVSFIVEAAAGTGKTTALVGRVLNLLRTGKGSLDRMVIVTFTTKAAGELKLRLRTELERAQGETEEEQERLHRALEALEVAHVSTIHGFCAELLRERPVEAAIDPEFEVLTERGADERLDEVLNRWYQHALEDPPEALRRLLKRSGWTADHGPRHALRGAMRGLLQRRDFEGAWERRTFHREARIDRWVELAQELGAKASRAANGGDKLAIGLRVLERWSARLREREAVSSRDYDQLEQDASWLLRHKTLWRWKGRGKSFGDGLLRADVVRDRGRLHDLLAEFVELAEADLAAALNEELWKLVPDYEAAKDQAGALDFLDLMLRVRDLLREDEVTRGHLRQRYDHIIVDEFQDTDPLQAEILLWLASDGDGPSSALRPQAGKLFIVGDPKQAIYRFRRADIRLYQGLKKRLVRDGMVALELSTSFRSRPSIQAVVNRGFEDHMPGDFDESVQCAYVPLARHREESEGQPSVVALSIPAPMSDKGNVTSGAVSESEPQAVAAFVQWLVEESGWTTEDGQGARPIEPRDVWLLFRALRSFRSDATAPYVRALEARQIPHLDRGGRAFFESEEVMAVGAVLEAIEWPRDKLAVYAALRGPFFSLSDGELLRFRHRHEGLHPLRWKTVEGVADEDRPVASALKLLRELHFRRNRRPVAATLEDLYGSTDVEAALSFWPNGEQVRANLRQCVEEARVVEREGLVSFRRFVERLRAGEDEGMGRPLADDSTAGVRIMTVHGAKGLEFPVVILCDCTRSGHRKNADRLVDQETGTWVTPICGLRPIELIENNEELIEEDHAEELRIAYVAATRAKDLLVVPAVGAEQLKSSWLGPLYEALYPPRDKWRKSSEAAGCPAFREDTVLVRPEGMEDAVRNAVKPGAFACGDGSFVWWDPATLPLEVSEAPPAKQTQWLSVEPRADGEPAARVATWEAERDRALAQGGKASLKPVAVTTLAVEGGGAVKGVTVEVVRGRDMTRPRGPRFGTLVHDVLERVSLEASAAAVSDLTELVGRMHGCPDEEVQAAFHAVSAALAHPRVREAARAKVLMREAATVVPDGERIVEGSIDLLYGGGEGFVVVDFKTDLEGYDGEVYRRQVGIYVDAVGAATGRGVCGVVLAV